MEHTAPGFRFYPTEEELITFYLHNKLHGHGLDLERIIPSIDIYNFEPHLLPGLAGQACQGDMEQWFFFAPQQEREARGGRTNRTTVSGYWKATGSPSHVYSQNDNRVIGMKKTMVFYKGKAPNGRKTKWKMNEYKAIVHQENLVNNDATKVIVASSSSNVPQLRHEISLCRVYVTSKCARSFDRRPAPETRTTTTTTTTMTNMNAQHATINISNINQELGSSSGIGTSSQSINATTFLSIEGSSSSTDSANSEGNNSNNVQGQETLQNQVGSTSNNFEDIESLWDSWDQLNWP